MQIAFLVVVRPWGVEPQSTEPEAPAQFGITPCGICCFKFVIWCFVEHLNHNCKKLCKLWFKFFKQYGFATMPQI